MGTIKPQQNQNIFEDNDQFDLTEDISVYKDLKTGREAFKKDIVEYYSSRNLKPATALTEEEEYLLDKFSGIDYMIIEDDFIIY